MSCRNKRKAILKRAIHFITKLYIFLNKPFFQRIYKVYQQILALDLNQYFKVISPYLSYVGENGSVYPSDITEGHQVLTVSLTTSASRNLICKSDHFFSIKSCHESLAQLKLPPSI